MRRINHSSRFIEMQATSTERNVLGDFIERVTPERCGDKDLPVLSVTKEYAMVFQNERFEATIVSRDKSNYIIAPRGYLVQGIHIDESNFGIQNLVDEGIVSPAYKLWKFKNQEAIPELLEYYLRSPMAIKYFNRHFLGATVPRRQVIKKDDFLAMPLNLPKMGIQQEYYSFFRQADKSKFSGFKSRFIEECYSRYPKQMLGSHISVVRGVSYKPSDVRSSVDDGGAIILRSNNIADGEINFDDLVYVAQERVQNEQKLKSGDIVMCGSNGIISLVGKAGLLKDNIPNTAFGAFCLGIKCKETILPEYLNTYFNTPVYRNEIESMGNGTNIINIKPNNITNLSIPIPPFEKQKAFVEVVNQADKSKYLN